MRKIDGWLKATRISALPRCRSGNPMAQLADLVIRSHGPQKVNFWYLASYGYQYRLGKNLPKGLTEASEDEWVELYASVEEWQNGFGAYCRRARTEKPKSTSITMLRKRVEELEEALEFACEIFDEMDSTAWDEDSGWQSSSYEGTAEHCRKALRGGRSGE